MKPLRSALLTLAVSALSLGGIACQSGTLTEEETLVGEASAALTVAEESGDVTADAVGLESTADLSASAEESAELPPTTTESDGVCDFRVQKQRVLAKYDTDGDGTLSATEREALRADLKARVGHPVAVRFAVGHRAHVMKRLRWVFDENNDHSLSSEERTAMIDALEARCERIRGNVMERFDSNGDGELDSTEKQAAKQALIARLQASRQQLLAKYDANGNGVLDNGERLQLRADRITAFQARRAELIATYDVNGDGTLDDAEKLALKKAIQQRIVEGRNAE
jgi:hypothetical protein